MRAARLVRLLLLLQSRGPSTAARLAGELEVSVRTIYRDVEALSEAGVPVWTERGPGGGIRLVDGYQTRLTGLTGDEAGSLPLIGVPAAAQQLGLGAVMAAATLKIDAALPPELRARAVRVRERFLVDSPGWFQRSEHVPCLPALSEAVWAGRRVELRYRRRPRAGEPLTVRRRVDPLGLVLKAGTWYLLALAGRRREERVFRVDRVVSVRALTGTVARPDGFDLAVAWGEAGRSFERDLFRVLVVARMHGRDLGRLRRVVPATAHHAAVASARPDRDGPGPTASPRDPAGDADGGDRGAGDVGGGDDGGWVRFELPTESIEVAHDQLLALGAVVEVLDPPELRRLLARTGARLAALNRTAAHPPPPADQDGGGDTPGGGAQTPATGGRIGPGPH